MDLDTCSLIRSLLLQVNGSLTESLPLLSLEVTGTFISMAYTWHINTGTHSLFLGTNHGRMFQVSMVCNEIHSTKVCLLKGCVLLVLHTLNTNSTEYSVKQQICFCSELFWHSSYNDLGSRAPLFHLGMAVTNKYCWSPTHIIYSIIMLIPQILFVSRLTLWIQLMLS